MEILLGFIVFGLLLWYLIWFISSISTIKEAAARTAVASELTAENMAALVTRMGGTPVRLKTLDYSTQRAMERPQSLIRPQSRCDNEKSFLQLSLLLQWVLQL